MKFHTRRFALAASLVGLSLGLACPASADSIAIAGIQNPQYFISDGQTLGWQFTVGTAIDVTALGFEVLNGTSLFDAHEVGIFDAGSHLMVSATVPAGPASPLDALGFEYVAVSPTLLVPGIYRIGASYPVFSPDLSFGMATSVTASSPITYMGDRLIQGTSLADPTVAVPQEDFGFFGPNFKFVAVPEPSSLVLGLVGVAGMLRQYRARRDGGGRSG